MINWKGSKVLVAGGAGMIGAHLARELVKSGAIVTVVDNMSSGSPENIKDILDSIRLKRGDLRDYFTAFNVVQGQDIVFQLAADMGGIGYIIAIGANIMHNSGLCNMNMLEAARVCKTPHYFYSSSACIYPEYKQTTPDVIPLKESDAYPAMPDQFYGWEKLFSEKLAEAYQEDYGMNIKVARFHNIYGDGFTSYDAKKAKAPCHLIIKAIKHPNPEMVLWGDGKATRSFLYIGDCVEMVLRLMQTDHDEPINIGSDRMVSVDELADLVIAASGKSIMYGHDISKPQGVRGRNADLTIAREVLGYEPQTSLEVGLKQVYEWAERHYDELEGIER